MKAGTCLVCGGSDLEPVVDLGSSPATTGALHDDAAGARAVRCGRMELVGCRACGHVSNRAFDEALVDYDASYDNSLHFSAAFQRYASALAERLVASYPLAGKHVVEIGSGRGDFLAALTSLAGATGTGYDPSYTPDQERPGIRLIPEYFRPEQGNQPYDLLVCRHVMEHLSDPTSLLAGLRASAPADAIYYLEVPAAEFCFGACGMWDCIYPHVSYFSRTSLRHLVERCGFEVLAEGTGFDGEFLWLEARPTARPAGTPAAEDVEAHLAMVRRFAERWQQAVGAWRGRVDGRVGGDDGLALWGAGAKAVTFLNAVDPSARMHVTDLNPRKWGRYMPGTGHLVQPPESLLTEGVSEVLITNPVYRAEIACRLQEMGVSAAVTCVV